MEPPFFSPSLSENIVFRDVNVGFAPEARLAAFERIARLLQYDDDIVRIRIDMTQDSHAAAEDRFVARGELDLGGPTLLATVSNSDPLRALDFLLERCESQLLRRRAPVRVGGR